MKNKNKILLVILTLILALLIFNNSKCYAGGLNAEQRKEFVAFVVDTVEQGQQKNLFRYTQGAERMGTYNWSVVTNSVKQKTPGTAYLTADGAIKLEIALKATTGKDIQIRNMAYSCIFLGGDMKGTIGTDCSAFCSAMYHLTSGTTFQYTSYAFDEDKAGLFSSSSDVSSAEPGDVLWKEGHVAIYLGDYKGDGRKYIAEAQGFQANKSKVKPEMSDKLLQFLLTHLTYVKEHPNYNKKMPELQLPAEGILDSRIQVLIGPLRSGRFDKVLKYTGEVKAGTKVDFSNLAAVDSDSSAGNNIETTDGSDNRVLNLPGNNPTFWPANLNLSDETLATSKGYFYKGTPTYGQYKGTINVFDWFISDPSDVLDWIVGFVVMGFKVQFIGWTAILENVISNILNFGVDDIQSNNKEQALLETKRSVNEQEEKVQKEQQSIEENIEENQSVLLGHKAMSRAGTDRITPSTTQPEQQTPNQQSSNVQPDSSLLESDAKKVITIEDVLFNRVPVLDINFFNFKEAGGQTLSEGSLLYTIRSTIANWYYSLRTVVIMGMLVALLYVAIRISLSTIASEKAEYKNKLKDWLVGFIIVMSIHYFMIILVNFNYGIVNILDPVAAEKTSVATPEVQTNDTTKNTEIQENKQISLYEAIKVQSYDIRASTGFTATIMYMVLVFLLIRFIILYTKRLFTLAILTIISPIMGIMYAINKKSAPFKEWMQEYSYNVLIQFFHTVIYTALVSIAFGLASTTLFKGALLALILLGFMFNAEELIKKIFGMSKSKSLSNLTDSTLGQLVMVGAGKKFMENSASVVAGSSSRVNKTLKKFNDWGEKKYKNQIQPYNWAKQFEPGENETEEERRDRTGNKILRANSIKPDTVMLNGKEYLLDKPRRDEHGNLKLDKNGNPLKRTPYAPYVDRLDTDKYNHFTYSGMVNNKIEQKMREESEARKAYAMQGIKDARDTVIGMASIFSAVPMLVLNFKYGAGLGYAGIRYLNKGMGRRKIEGAKTIKHNKKLTGKKLVFAWATGGLSNGIENIKNNSEDTKYVLHTKYPKELALLKEARELEDKLGRKFVELNKELGDNFENINEALEGEASGDTEKVKEAQKKLKELAKKMDERSFQQAVNVTLQQIKKEQIEKVVNQYILKKDILEFKEEDIDGIVAEINRELKNDNKDIRVTEELIVNIKKQLREIAKTYVENETTPASKNTEENKNDDNARENDTEDVNILDDLNKKREEVSKDKPKGYEKKTLEFDVNNLKYESNAYDKKVEDKYKEIISNIDRKSMIEIISETLEKKQDVDRMVRNEKYQDMMQIVNKLNQVNETYRKTTGEPIYEYKDRKTGIPYENSVSELVQRMKKYIDKEMNN